MKEISIMDDEEEGSRRSRKFFANTTLNDDLLGDVNDDEAERNRSRLQLEEEHKSNRSFSSNLHVSVCEKSISSIIEHYQNCIKLSAENKITTKNAFSLHLIEYFSTLLKKRDKEMNDFSAVGCTLDASVKIYAYRVDSVYDDTLKLDSDLRHVKTHKSDDKDESKSNEDGEPPKKKTKRAVNKVKCTLVTNMEEINRKKVDADVLGSRRRLFNSDIGIITNCMFDSNKLCLHIDDNRPYWRSEKQTECKDAENRCPIQLIDLMGNEAICRTFQGFDFQVVVSKPSIRESIQDKFDLNSSFQGTCGFEHQMDIDTECIPMCNDDDDIGCDNNDDYAITDHDADTGAQLSCVSHTTTTAAANFTRKSIVTDKIAELIASKPSEYCYFDSKLLSTWMEKVRDARHWNPFRRKLRDSDRTKERTRTRKEKRESVINFTDVSKLDEMEEIFNGARITSPQRPNWSRMKLLTTPNFMFDVKDFFRLNCWREMYVNLKGDIDNIDKEPPIDVDDSIADYECGYSPSRQNEDFENCQDKEDGNYPPDTDLAYTEENLLDAPMKVAKFEINYAKREKAISMRKLKQDLWEVMSPLLSQDEDKELTFSTVCCKIAEKKRAENDELPPTPVLFSAILYLANEKCLILKNTHGLKDFTIIRA